MIWGNTLYEFISRCNILCFCIKGFWRADAPFLSKYVLDLSAATSKRESADSPLWKSRCHSQRPTHLRPLFCLHCFILFAFSPGRRLWLLRSREQNLLSVPVPSLSPGVWLKRVVTPLGLPLWQRVTLQGCFKSEFNGSVVRYPADSPCRELLHFWLGRKCLEWERTNRSLCPHSFVVTRCRIHVDQQRFRLRTDHKLSAVCL